MSPSEIFQQADIKSITSVLTLLFGSGFALKWAGRFRKKQPESHADPPNIFRTKGGFFSQTVRFAIGSYVELHRPPNSPIRITACEVIKHKFSFEEVDGIVLDISTGGGLVYGGEGTKKVSTNRYALPVMRFSEQMASSAYYFYVAEDYTSFFRCVVDHLNLVAGEVSLDIHHFTISHPRAHK